MKQYYSYKHKKKVYEIFAGEFYVTDRDNVFLETLLGSCVAVCLQDKLAGISGINHFMLPGTRSVEDIILGENAKYGINAMELLINEMLEYGAFRERLEAKVFGGGRVLTNGLSKIGVHNIKFVKAYLNMEGIPVIASDVGGVYGRKIIFYTGNFSVYMKKVHIDKRTILREKAIYKNMEDKNKKGGGDITIFDRRFVGRKSQD